MNRRSPDAVTIGDILGGLCPIVFVALAFVVGVLAGAK
jgi:hypothetical protein